MSPKTDLVIQFLHVISWIIFIGLCYQTGALIFNYTFMQFHVFEVENLYLILDLSELFTQNEIYFGLLFSLAISVNALKAYTFLLITKIFKNLNLHKPFSEKISSLISKISYYTLSTYWERSPTESIRNWPNRAIRSKMHGNIGTITPPF